jgi:hypothetical protein
VFAVNKMNGTWHKARPIPGITGLNRGGFASVASVSCASAGDCSAGGTYTGGSKHVHAFIVNEVNGTWHHAIEVPGTVAVDQYSVGGVSAVSCAAPGNCSAAGTVRASRNPLQKQHSFVVSEVNGRWHTATAVPGLDRLSQSGTAHFYALSCGAVAHCSAGGIYDFADNPANEQAFLVTEK